MKTLLTFASLGFLLIVVSFSSAKAGEPAVDYDYQNGKIEAAMNDEITTAPKTARAIIEKMNLLEDDIDLKYSKEENFSDGRLAAVGAFVTMADDLKTQIDGLVLNRTLSIDDKYAQINSALKEMRLLLKQAMDFR